jgi:hypothetical protein
VPHADTSAKVLWSNQGSGTGTTLTASGNSSTATAPTIDLRYVSSLWLAVEVTGTPGGTTPTLDVYLDVRDAAGNWFTQVAHATPQITGTAATAQVSIGLHLPAGTGMAPMVLPESGRVSWVLSGTNPSYAAVISLYGR